LHLAEEILRTSEIQVKLGSLAPVDLLQSQTGVALRKEELVSSKNLLLTAEDVLKQLLQLPDAPLYSAVHVVPTDVPPPVPEHEEFSLEEVLRMSLKNRPELRAAHRDFETKNLQIKLAENQLLPKLDFAGGVGLNGLGGSPKETSDFSALAALDPLELFLVLIGAREPPKTTSPWGGGWQRSFYDMFHGESTYQWNVGMRFEIPLENNTAEASYRKAKMEAYKSLWTLRSLEQRILLEVRDAWRALEMNRQKIRTSEVTRALAEKQLDAERKRMSLGLTTNYQVFQMEQDFRNAQVKSLVALAEYWKARAKMLKAAGTLLEKEGFSPKDVLSQGSS
jgi:outer membrane protein TolC